MSWIRKELSEVCEIKLGKTPSRSDKSLWDVEKNSNNKWASIADLSKVKGRNIFDTKEYISEKGAKLFKPVEANTILMSFKLSIGKLAITTEKIYTNEAIVALPIKIKDKISQDFLYYYLQFYDWDKESENDIKVKGKTLNKEKLKKIKVPLPPIATQQKIVAKLDAIFAEIDTATAATEANAKNAEALFQSYITEVFKTEKYDFKLLKFGTTASFVRGPFGGSLKKSIFVEKGYAVYEQQHAIYNQFSDVRYFIDKSKFEEMKRFELKSGDLIMSCSGTMGKIAIVPENIEQGVINQALLKISPNNSVMGEYIARLLSSKYFQDILTKLSGGAAIQNVPAVSVLKVIEVPIPSIKNQKLIVDIIDVLESNKSIIKNSYKSKSKELATLKQSILQKAFSGELVKD